MQRSLVASAALVLAGALAGLCQQPQPLTFFKAKVGLQDSEIQQISQGQVVTKVLPSGDQKYGVLVFGAVYVNAPVDRFAGAVRDIKALLNNKVYKAVGVFSADGKPPQVSDFAGLELERKDVDQLQTCKPGDCDIQIMQPESWQKKVDWNSPNKYNQVNQIAREKLCQNMTVYLTSGLKAAGSYTDRSKPLALYDATKSMIDSSYYLPRDKAPGIYRHIVDYPVGKMPGAQDLFYWEKIDFGQEPTVRVNHVTIFPEPVGPAKQVVVNEQLYASRYMRVALQGFYCVPDTQNPNKPGFYLIEMNDSRLPDFGSLKLGIVRKVATGKAVEGTRDTLQMYARMLGGA